MTGQGSFTAHPMPTAPPGAPSPLPPPPARARFGPVEWALVGTALVLAGLQTTLFLNAFDAVNRAAPNTSMARQDAMASLLAGGASIALLVVAGVRRPGPAAAWIPGPGAGALLGFLFGSTLIERTGPAGGVGIDLVITWFVAGSLILGFLVATLSSGGRFAASWTAGAALMPAVAYAVMAMLFLANLERIASEAQRRFAPRSTPGLGIVVVLVIVVAMAWWMRRRRRLEAP